MCSLLYLANPLVRSYANRVPSPLSQLVPERLAAGESALDYVTRLAAAKAVRFAIKSVDPSAGS